MDLISEVEAVENESANKRQVCALSFSMSNPACRRVPPLAWGFESFALPGIDFPLFLTYME
jgi:hypothetical protein